MIDADDLLADTKRQVVSLVDDLRTVAATDPDAAAHVTAEYSTAHAAGRTAFGEAEWAEGLYAQVAVAWVLGCVFVRFCEDNYLIDDPLLGGPGIRSQIALDHRAAHLQANPSHDDRHWLREVFSRMRHLPATGDIFGAHNPVWAADLLPSADGARKLREELARVDPNTGDLRHDFSDPAWDTRFLGDLYQDLSVHAKKTFALLQTPAFVEEFILDRTLDPSIATFGLAAVTIIDPTCGSGHFLLGAFSRLFQRWCESEPATNRRELAQRSLKAIGGVDLNPFAASIARFRLLLSALRAGGDSRLVDAPTYEIHIAVGDSLLHGDPPGRLDGMSFDDEEAAVAAHGYTTEDSSSATRLLSRRWHAVVGNPPYIAVKDSALRDLYRSRYRTCGGRYTLGVPFTEQFFHLAIVGTATGEAGFVGMITANSFMKKEFGKRLVEQWFSTVEVTHIVDTSGASIPGHGTPTVILLGRNRLRKADTVRVVSGIRGEPGTPAEPRKGKVWSSIVDLVDFPNTSSDFVSVADIERHRLTKHPWSIGGGGAADLKERLDGSGVTTLGHLADAIGITAVTGLDDVFHIGDVATARRFGLESTRPLIGGDLVRDWQVSSRPCAVWTYDRDLKPRYPSDASRRLWQFKAALSVRKRFGTPMLQRGLQWWEWQELYVEKLRRRPLIALAGQSTHNHFVLDESDSVFLATAPVVVLPPNMSEAETYRLLGLLNSSAVCFWLRQVSHNKGSTVDSKGSRQTSVAFEDYYVYDAAKLKKIPVPKGGRSESAQQLTQIGLEVVGLLDHLREGTAVPSAEAIGALHTRYDELRSIMIATQERLDWHCYREYGLVSDDLVSADCPDPPLMLGERAFEIALARRMATDGEHSTWFSRHGSTPVVDTPSRWPAAYRSLVERRVDAIHSDSNLRLIEQPEYKRRWSSRPWDDQVRTVLKLRLLDRLEAERYWPEPAAITTVARLTADARTDEEFMSVARLYARRDDVDLGAVIADLIKGESVAYLAAWRYSDSGLRKYAEWLDTWSRQRREDAGEDVGPIAVPSKYSRPDFNGVGWEHRGKLDVPKERFICYPGAERETDASAVIGWAGWNPLDRARALAAWYLQARRDGRDAGYLTPLLAGLAELVPWLKQWYDEPSADPALDRPGTQIAALVETELRSLFLTAEDLVAWRPEKKRAGRKRKAAE